MGRVDADDLYNVVKNYRWGNFKDLKFILMKLVLLSLSVTEVLQ